MNNQPALQPRRAPSLTSVSTIGQRNINTLTNQAYVPFREQLQRTEIQGKKRNTSTLTCVQVASK